MVDDYVRAFDDAWARFQTVESLRLVADTLEAEWTHGRAQYLTFLIRVEDAAAREHIARVQQRLDGIPGVELYPDWYWHITVKGVGFQVIKRTHDDDILRQDVPRIAGKARALLKQEPAFDAQLGRVNAFAEVVFVEVFDGGRGRQTNQRMCDELPEVPRYPFDGPLFLPHVSIARFTSSDGLAQLKAALASLREEGAGPGFAVQRVEFIKAWLSEATPEFDTLSSYPLAPEKRA